MQIYIPTRGRVRRQLTLNSLPEQLRQRTWLVCPRDEVQELKKLHPNVIAQPAAITTIAEKRHWIIKEAHKRGEEKLAMLDDDMGFYARHPDWPNRRELLKVYATEQRIIETFQWMEDMLDQFAHVGIGSRLGNHTIEECFRCTTRMMHTFAFHVPTVIANVKFNRVAFREDFDYTLQLLRKGYDNIVRYDVVCAPSAYGSAGGCDLERDVAKSDAEAEKLAALHPGLVKVVQKNYKGIPRKEVVVYWKKAYRYDVSKA